MQLIDEKPRLPVLAALLTLAFGALAACAKQPEAPVPATPADAAGKPASTCGGKGNLQAGLAGAIGAQLDWPDEALRCESMPRPDEEGVRLRFSGDIDGQRLAIIVALPGLHAGQTGNEFDSNVTISVEGSGRFFSTPNLDTCWTDIATNEPLEDDPDTYAVVGELTCVGPLGELNGDGFVDIRLLRFSGVGKWSTE